MWLFHLLICYLIILLPHFPVLLWSTEGHHLPLWWSLTPLESSPGIPSHAPGPSPQCSWWWSAGCSWVKGLCLWWCLLCPKERFFSMFQFLVSRNSVLQSEIKPCLPGYMVTELKRSIFSGYTATVRYRFFYDITSAQGLPEDYGPSIKSFRYKNFKNQQVSTDLDIPRRLIFYHSIEKIFYCHCHWSCFDSLSLHLDF